MTLVEFKEKIGQDVYAILEKESEKEVAISLAMDLVDEYQQKKYYRQRFLFNDLLEYFDHFEKLEIKILPIEVVNILFRCKLAFAVSSEDEYIQRVGGGSFVDDYGFIVDWGDKSLGVEIVIENRFNILFSSLSDNALLTPINDYNSLDSNLQEFFDNLFIKLELPFIAYVSADQIIEKHKLFEPHLKNYNEKTSERFFQLPSISYTTFGSKAYISFYSKVYLRAFLNMLRIGNFINPPQIDFGSGEVRAMAPISSVILGSHSEGCYCWQEDEKRPWEKMPDGSLFLSFGYRGLSKMWLDGRCWESLDNFYIDNKVIFECLKNPWSKKVIKDVEPVLDILSSVTQIPDLGAKILLIYCCLEHLFVPGTGKTDNKTYIVGGIHALKPELLPWFDELYKLRCDYAHKGFILHDKKLLMFIFSSIKNLFLLLTIKLEACRN